MNVYICVKREVSYIQKMFLLLLPIHCCIKWWFFSPMLVWDWCTLNIMCYIFFCLSSIMSYCSMFSNVLCTALHRPIVKQVVLCINIKRTHCYVFGMAFLFYCYQLIYVLVWSHGSYLFMIETCTSDFVLHWSIHCTNYFTKHILFLEGKPN